MMFRVAGFTSGKTRPVGLKWRSSIWFVTTVIGLGIFTDSFFYMLIVPIIPFRLESLGYKDSSSLTGWLLFAFSAGLVISSPPIAWVSERVKSRKLLFNVGILALIGSQIMFMLAPWYWLLVVARAIQGMSSTIVFAVGLALLSDTCPENKIGQQIGLATSGLPLGAVLAPPIGGTMYARLGFHAPFILSLGLLALDLIGRLLVVERKEALKWHFDPSPPNEPGGSIDEKDAVVTGTDSTETNHSNSGVVKELDENVSGTQSMETAHEAPILSPLKVLLVLARSRRTLGAIISALFYSTCYTAQEPTLPLRLQDNYGQKPVHIALLYLAIVVPTVLCGFFSGKLSDRVGPGLISTIAFFFTIPWLIVMIIHGSLALIMVGAVFSLFFLAGALTPITAELNAVTRRMPGIGYTHVYGGFNMAYGIGSAVGPLVAGQLYDHAPHGWTAVMLLSAATAGVGACICFSCLEEVPLLFRVLGRRNTSQRVV